MKNIFFIGLGNMGKPMVNNLIKNNFQLTIFDINKNSYNSFKDKNVKIAKSTNEISNRYDVIFTMIPDGKVLKNIVKDKNNNIFSKKTNNLIWIDCSSIDLKTTLEISNILKNNNIHFLDSPVSGGVSGAINGSLSIMVGGEKKTFMKVKKLFYCIGKNVSYLGSSGAGQIVKACNNMMLGINMLGICEAFTMAKSLGVSERDFFKICSVSSSSSWAMLNHLPIEGLVKNSAANKNFKAGYAAKLISKDLKIALALAKEAGVNITLGKNASKKYDTFCKGKNQDLDYSAIIKTVKKK